MFDFLFKAPAWQLIAQADVMTKLVLFSLFLLSIFCTWIVVCKILVLRKQKLAMRRLMLQIKRAQTFDDLLKIGKEFRHYSGGKFLVRVLGDLKEMLSIEGASRTLSGQDLDRLQTVIDQSLESVLAEEEQYLPVLGTSAVVSPLVGLFGTVWGLVHAFVSISQNKSADISVVAPGIAEALTTTLAGLAVAIPAVVFFHYFSNEIRKLEQQIVVVSDKLLVIVKQTFLR